MKLLQVTVNEAVRLIGLHRATLYRMEAAGEITFNRVRGRTFVPMRELERIAGETRAGPERKRVRRRRLVTTGALEVSTEIRHSHLDRSAWRAMSTKASVA